MKLPIYLIIETGYEGIEALCHLTDDVDEAKATKKREEDRVVEERKSFLVHDREIGMSKAYIEEQESRLGEARDFICVQKWDGKSFDCACGDLGVSPSKLMLR
jgi:hypothetical protein